MNYKKALEFNKFCSIEDCDNPTRSGSCEYCEKHYYRMRRNGTMKLSVNPIEFNKDFFFQMNSNFAWFLGLMWTDGCIYDDKKIDYVSKDKQLIDDIVNNIGLKSGGLGLCYDKYWRIKLTDKDCVDRLKYFGITERKSLTIDWPKNLPEEFEKDFIRGCIDGDGSVVVSKRNPHTESRGFCQVILGTASNKFKDGILEFYTKNDIKYSCSSHTKNRKNTFYTITISKSSSLEEVADLIYYNIDLPCLQRKRDKLLNFINLPKPKIGRPCTKNKLL